MIGKVFIVLALVLIAMNVDEIYGQSQDMDEIQTALIHPVMWNQYMCIEHGGGFGLGDSYGKDCLAMQDDPDKTDGRRIPRLFENDGHQNEDWYGWEAPLLAPCTGKVDSTKINSTVNEPGHLPKGEAFQAGSKIVFECDSGIHVIYAHIRNLYVAAGDRVKAGAIVAEIGNNGISNSPHVHIGAWQNQTPLQIRFDLRFIN